MAMICRLHDIARASFDFQEPGPFLGGPWLDMLGCFMAWFLAWWKWSHKIMADIMAFLFECVMTWAFDVFEKTCWGMVSSLQRSGLACRCDVSTVIHCPRLDFHKNACWCWGIQVKMEESSQNSEPAGYLDQEWQRAHHWWSPQVAVQGHEHGHEHGHSIHRQLAIKSNFKCSWISRCSCLQYFMQQITVDDLGCSWCALQFSLNRLGLWWILAIQRMVSRPKDGKQFAGLCWVLPFPWILLA